MFFKKSKKSEEGSDEAVVKRGIKKMDAMLTGAVLGGVVASLYGVKKLKDAKKIDEELDAEEHIEADIEQLVEQKIEEKKQKKWFFQKFFK